MLQLSVLVTSMSVNSPFGLIKTPENGVIGHVRLARATRAASPSKTPSTTTPWKDYWILLSSCETCKYNGLDFLDFLRSGKRSIDGFATKSK